MEISAAVQTAKKFKVDIYKLIWFNLGVMVDTVELFIFILVYVTLTLIEGHEDARKWKLLCQLSLDLKYH